MLRNDWRMGLAAAACALLGMGASEAAVTLTFEQVGADVTATWSGTYDLALAWEYSPSMGGGTRVSPEGTYGHSDMYGFNTGAGVASFIPAIIFTTGTYSGDSFGFNGDWLMGPVSASVGAYEPVGTMTFANKTLAEMGLSSLSNTLAFTGSGNVGSNRQIFFTTIPEPSCALSAMTGILCSALRRRRSK